MDYMERSKIRSIVEEAYDNLEVTARLCQLLSLCHGEDSCVSMDVVGDSFHAIRQRIEESNKALDVIITAMYTGKNLANE